MGTAAIPILYLNQEKVCEVNKGAKSIKKDERKRYKKRMYTKLNNYAVREHTEKDEKRKLSNY